MSGLTLALLGPLQITGVLATPVVRARKELALLAYLAVESHQVHSRDTLLGMFWPEASEEAARNSLRVALANLRAALGQAAGPYLTTSRHHVQFSAASDHTLDVAAFEALLAKNRAHGHAHGALCVECAARLTEAISLYRGDFLSGFFLPDSVVFEEWALIQRERLHQQMIETLDVLALYHEQLGDYAALARDARRQIELEPWREHGHRRLMRALAAMGDRAAALAAFERCRQVLEAEFGAEPDAETVMLNERISAGELAPASTDGSVPGFGLPANLTPFVGRERALATIIARLRQADVRLLTLVGAGGMGKTRLALEVVRYADGSSDLPTAAAEPDGLAFRDGVFFVSLAPLSTAVAIVPTIAAAIGLSLQGDPKQALLRALKDKRLLLLLDNFEHLLVGVELVMDILQAAPGVKVIATSRERLKLRGEHIHVVEGLDYRVEDMAASSAVRLFVQSARRVQADFAANGQTLAHVLQICNLVNGMPLGIELAAAWVETLPLETIAAEVERSVDFLAYDWRDAPKRQRSMRAVFDWSWQLLNAAEQQALRGLSVFRGGCTPEAAQAVATPSPRVLTRLVHTSLLRWSFAAGRYEMHELVRQFAAEQLDASSERLALEARHSDYYLQFVEKRERQLTHDKPDQVMAEIRAELDNVRQAWAWAAAHLRLDQLDRSAFGLGLFYTLSGLLAEGAQAQALAAEHIGHSFAHARGDQLAHRTSERLLSKHLAFQAMFLNLQSAYAAALPLARQAIDLCQASGCVEGEAMAELTWGVMLAREGKLAEARSRFERILHLSQQTNDSYPHRNALSEIEFRAVHWLAVVAMRLDDYAEARDRLTHELRSCQARESSIGEIQSLHRLAYIAFSIGDYAAARRDAEQALQLARAFSYPWGEGVAQLRLGQALPIFGEYERAAALLERALKLFREIGDRAYEADTLAYLGHLAESMGNYARANDLLGQALQLSQATKAHEPALNALVFLSSLSHHTGDHKQALRYAEQAWPIAQAIGSRLRQAQALVARGRALAGSLQPTAAATAFQQALGLYAEIGGTAPLTSAPRANLAAVALAQGRLEQAFGHVEAIVSLLVADDPLVMAESFEVYLTSYRVLKACGDPHAATLLQTAQRYLHEYAGCIADVALRRSFLENVAIHRRLRYVDTDGGAAATPAAVSP